MITKEPRTIPIDPDSELGRALQEFGDVPVVLVCGAKIFRVAHFPEDPRVNYDPEAVRQGLREIAGTLSPEEGDRIIQSIYRGREEGTRPITRP
jgi:hypothetical protein